MAKIVTLPEALPDFIELDVPISRHGNAGAHSTTGLMLSALARAPIGASVLLKGVKPNAASGIAQRHLGKGRYTTRKEADGIRVWRTA